jgi:hypothetical protein
MERRDWQRFQMISHGILRKFGFDRTADDEREWMGDWKQPRVNDGGAGGRKDG